MVNGGASIWLMAMGFGQLCESHSCCLLRQGGQREGWRRKNAKNCAGYIKLKYLQDMEMELSLQKEFWAKASLGVLIEAPKVHVVDT